jgi:hypothetical protein
MATSTILSRTYSIFISGYQLGNRPGEREMCNISKSGDTINFKKHAFTGISTVHQGFPARSGNQVAGAKTAAPDKDMRR